MCVYLRAKFEVSNIILMSFRQGVIPPPTSKRTPKMPTQISVKNIYYLTIWSLFISVDVS